MSGTVRERGQYHEGDRKEAGGNGTGPHYYDGYTGLTADIKGGKAGAGTKTVALRADIDALPVEEHTGLEFCSRNDGVMHAEV